MKNLNLRMSLAALPLLAAAAILAPHAAQAHCDGLAGPVVKAAQKALADSNVNLVLIWVQKDDQAQIKHAFEKTLAVRKLNPEARELADMYFFETLVRIHRAGEGAPFTGLKPAGTELGPAIEEADKALESGSVEKVVKLVTDEAATGIRQRFAAAREKKAHAEHNLEAGRAFVAAYVEYIHYVEGLHQTAQGASAHHAEGHEAAPAKDAHQEPAPQHKH